MHEEHGLACRLSSRPVMRRAHRHDDVELSLATGGWVEHEHAGRRGGSPTARWSSRGAPSPTGSARPRRARPRGGSPFRWPTRSGGTWTAGWPGGCCAAVSACIPAGTTTRRASRGGRSTWPAASLPRDGPPGWRSGRSGIGSLSSTRPRPPTRTTAPRSAGTRGRWRRWPPSSRVVPRSDRRRRDRRGRATAPGDRHRRLPRGHRCDAGCLPAALPADRGAAAAAGDHRGRRRRRPPGGFGSTSISYAHFTRELGESPAAWRRSRPARRPLV